MTFSHNLEDYVHGLNYKQYGFLGQLSELFPLTERPAILLSHLAWAATWLGRRVFARFAGEAVFANLFVAMIGSSLSWRRPLAYVRACFGELDFQPLVAETGVHDTQSLVYLIRDPICNPQKVFKKPEDDPEFRLTIFDAGTEERRLLLAVPSLGWIFRPKGTKVGLSLAGTFSQAFAGGNIGQLITPKEGFLKSSKPHVSVLTTCSDRDLTFESAEIDELFFFARTETKLNTTPPFSASEFAYLQTELCLALSEATGEIGVSREALDVFEHALLAPWAKTGDVAGLKLLKLAVLLAVLDGAHTISKAHADASLALLRYSEATRHVSDAKRDSDFIEMIALRIEKLLRKNVKGLSRTEISAAFSRKLSQRILDAAVDRLLRLRRVTLEIIPTGGRPCQVLQPACSSLQQELEKVSELSEKR